MYADIRNFTKKQVDTIALECNLNTTEKDILFMLSKGDSLQEISNCLLIAPATVTRKIRKIRNRIKMIQK